MPGQNKRGLSSHPPLLFAPDKLSGSPGDDAGSGQASLAIAAAREFATTNSAEIFKQIGVLSTVKSVLKAFA